MNAKGGYGKVRDAWRARRDARASLFMRAKGEHPVWHAMNKPQPIPKAGH